MEVAEKEKRIADLTGRLEGRVRRLRLLSTCVIASIVVLIIGAVASFVLAGAITSRESLDIAHRIELAKSRQGAVSEKLVPELIQISHNLNRISSVVVKRGLSTIKVDGISPQDLRLQYGSFQIQPSNFLSLDMSRRLVENAFKDVKQNDDTTISVYISLDGKRTDGAYVWSFKGSSKKEVLAALEASDIKAVHGTDKRPINDIDEDLLEREGIDTLIDVLMAEKSSYSASLVGNDAKDKSLSIVEAPTATGPSDGGSRAPAGAADTTVASNAVGKPKNRNADADIYNDANSSGALFYYIQLNLNKFGTVSLLIILIGILVSLYKYNTRLAAFYQARVDALQLQPTQDKVGFVRLASALTPSIDFSKADQTSSIIKILEHTSALKDGQT